MRAPRNLRATVLIALVVGTLLLLTYVVPFPVSNYGLLAATRRHRPGPGS